MKNVKSGLLDTLNNVPATRQRRVSKVKAKTFLPSLPKMWSSRLTICCSNSTCNLHNFHFQQRRCSRSCPLLVCYCVFVPSVASSLGHFSHSDAALVCCQLHSNIQRPGLPSVNDGHNHTSGFVLTTPNFFYLQLFAHAPSPCIQNRCAVREEKC